jgi:hypothetical protein
MSTHDFDLGANASQSAQARKPHLAHEPEPVREGQLRGADRIAALGDAGHAALLQRTAATQPARASQLARQLQRQRGNRYVAQLAAQARQSSPLVQPKLVVTAAGDQYEQEADRAAAQVMREIAAPASRPNDERELQSVRRPPDLVQRRTAGLLGGAQVEPGLESAIQSARGGGQGLPEALRGKLEQSFGADFGGVTIHANAEADQLNQSLQARAFTTGQDIFFRQGEYAPSSAEGQRLLTHELAHVVQQSGQPAGRKIAGGGGTSALLRAVVQREDSDDEEEDDDTSDQEFVVKESNSKRQPDPNANMISGSYKKEIDPATKKVKISFDTKGGAHHEEEYDPATGSSQTVTSGLTRLKQTNTRNATRKLPESFPVANPYGLSQGQSTLNQPVVSHRTPATFSMNAGGNYGNADVTSAVYNGQVIGDFEKRAEQKIQQASGPFTMTTTTKTELVKDNLRAEEIARLPGMEGHWKNKDRVKKRLETLTAANPNLRRVTETERTIKDGKGKVVATTHIKKPDLLLGIPARAHSKKAREKYEEARDDSSNESDAELKSPPKKSKKGS